MPCAVHVVYSYDTSLAVSCVTGYTGDPAPVACQLDATWYTAIYRINPNNPHDLSCRVWNIAFVACEVMCTPSNQMLCKMYTTYSIWLFVTCYMSLCGMCLWDVGCGMWDVGCAIWDVRCAIWDVLVDVRCGIECGCAICVRDVLYALCA